MSRSKSDSVRWVYEWEQDGEFASFPEVEMMGFDRNQEAMALSDHRHERCFEFVYVENSKVSWEVGDELHASHAGQFFHTKPGEWHRARFHYMEPSSIWWIIVVDPRELPDWLGFGEADRFRIGDALASLPRIVSVDMRVRESLLKLRGLLRQGTAADLFLVRHYLLAILLQLLYPPVARQLPGDLCEAMLALTAEIEADPERRWANKELAAKVGVSESHFYRLFQDMHGQSPAGYIDRLRMNRACELLRLPGTSVTGIAMDLGYKTSQHFATVFKKYMGVSPSQWRR
ncbi:helix-turn-helix transcriptional regulator [Paenibacillus sacheonensis]|uniref:Helix-turn-helix domain-containing protein n=1 Tax=Paenibacillus sacheonensis TaxID=742054 RepID=A0A7X4YJE9_9BACL|nr:AraC family transcriptional regulator [Paenibacillus sacheonensis]MBM7564176.1 AraC-like DNA-binding protein [Paenibacillus sacheonensis]NBC67496.1 helix-turn-helix domain-containing protein [Paenibacillus sacheonensis]